MKLVATINIALCLVFELDAQYLHPLAVVHGEDHVEYFMNDSFDVIPPDFQWQYRREARRSRSKKPFEIKDYDTEGNLIRSTEAFEPDPINIRFESDFIQFQLNGDTVMRMGYAAGMKEGRYVRYHPNGKKAVIGRFSEDEKEGIFQSYHSWGGNVMDSGRYINDLREGRWVGYYDNGNLRYVGHYIKGQKMGAWLLYHDNGMVAEERAFLSGKALGPYNRYYANQMKAESGSYLDGQRSGKWLGFYESGKPWYVAHYIEGDLEGPIVLISPGGDTVAEGAMTLQGFNGFERFYHPNGDTRIDRMYVNGTLMKEVGYGSDGTMETVSKMNGGILDEACFDSDGNEKACDQIRDRQPLEIDKAFSKMKSALVLPASNANLNLRAAFHFAVDETGRVTDKRAYDPSVSELDALVFEELEKLEFDPGFYALENAEYKNDLVIYIQNGSINLHVGEFYRVGTHAINGGIDDLLTHLEERIPKYAGGEQAMFQYIASETKFPAYAKEVNASGMNYVQFSVQPSGIITDVELLRSAHPSLDYEARRVVWNMPDWIGPSHIKEDQDVYIYKLPFRFTLK